MKPKKPLLETLDGALEQFEEYVQQEHRKNMQKLYKKFPNYLPAGPTAEEKVRYLVEWLEFKGVLS